MPRRPGLHLLGQAEMAKLLGVSRQRITQLAAKPWFPAPVARLTMGAVWELADIQQMAAETGRTLHPQALQCDTEGDTNSAAGRGDRGAKVSTSKVSASDTTRA